MGSTLLWSLHHADPGTDIAVALCFFLQRSTRREFCAYAGEYEGKTVVPVDRYTVRITAAKPASSILFLPKLNRGVQRIHSKARWPQSLSEKVRKGIAASNGPFSVFQRQSGHLAAKGVFPPRRFVFCGLQHVLPSEASPALTSGMEARRGIPLFNYPGCKAPLGRGGHLLFMMVRTS